MINYEEIKRLAVNTYSSCKMFIALQKTGDEEKIQQYLNVMLEKANEAFNYAPDHLASCVVFSKATSLAYDYYAEKNSPLFVAKAAHIFLNKQVNTLRCFPNSEEAQTMLLVATAQLLNGIYEFFIDRLNSTEDWNEIEIVGLALQAAYQMSREVCNNLMKINPDNIKLKSIYPFVNQTDLQLKESGIAINQEVATYGYMESLDFIKKLIDIYVD